MADFIEAEATIGHGKTLAWSATSNGTFAKIAGTVDIALPDRELGTAEITNDDSPDRHKDYIPALFEPGTLSGSYIYGATAFEAMEEHFQLAMDPATAPTATRYWKYTLPDGAIVTFRGFLTKHGMEPEMEEALSVEFEMQVRGPMTFTGPA
jgi:hypothetical protein